MFNIGFWNPAEIIGTAQVNLQTIYKYLITDEIWARQRSEFGYKDLTKLLHSFAGKPYIDVRASFNFFIPKNIDNKLSKRLVDFYLDG